MIKVYFLSWLKIINEIGAKHNIFKITNLVKKLQCLLGTKQLVLPESKNTTIMLTWIFIMQYTSCG